MRRLFLGTVLLLLALLAVADTPNVGIVPAPVNLTIEQGNTWSAQLAFADGNHTPINLSGYTFAAQVRPSYSSSAVTATFTCTVTDAAGGLMTISLTSTQTAALLAPSKGQWDLWMYQTSPATALRIMAGDVFVIARVTRTP